VVDRVYSISPDTARRFNEAGFDREVEILPISLPHYWKLEKLSPISFDHPVRLLAVARLSAFEKLKGIDHTIEAVALLIKRGMDIVFDVAGTGDDMARLVEIADSLKITDRVRFHGRVSNERLAELYRNASIFVLPSGSEGFGLVFLEAMAYGLPVVAADVAAAPVVVRPGESGCLVPYGNPGALSECLETLIRNPGSARALGLKGRAFLERNFTFAQYSSRFLSYIGLLPEDERKLGFESMEPMSGREK
jgi:glycosyltransferase involved in cell wall biosynthesis